MTNNTNSGEHFHVVAIDGGAASGKSSTSKVLAARRNFLHVDTGSHYRAVALASLQAGLHPADSARLREFICTLEFSSQVKGNESLICFEGGEPPRNEDLRSEAVNRTVSPYSALPFLRDAVKTYQRQQVQIAKENGFSGIVMDGRDIGTVILPHADLKIFLHADTETRQRRRTLEGASDTISERDKRDSTRLTAPLKPAEDAILLDNSHLSLEEVVDKIIALLPHRGLSR
jgi:cytidylate kinase